MKKNFRGAVCALSVLAVLGGVLPYASCKETEKEDLKVYMPDGAPALALAGMMAADTEDDGVSYHILRTESDPTLLPSKLTNNDEAKNADLCVLPVNAASKLVGNGEKYQMLGAVTHGNLYLLAKEGVTLDNLSSLIGKTIGVLKINDVPGLTLKATLNKKNIPWQEVGNDGEKAEDKVNLLAIAGADAVGATDADGNLLADYYMVAEPAATAQSKAKKYAIVGDIQALYGGENGYPQAVLVAKKSVVESRGEWTEEFVEKVETSIEWLWTASGEQIVTAVNAHMDDKNTVTSLKAPLLTSEVLGRCGIRFTYAKECKNEVNAFLTDLITVNSKAAAIPQDGFFWE
ncbi:MAG: ABC transporter substrate-binding protein [Clostridiales bacterium]|nr:ABC transporter substrate-binding protein [Clostridiales bacterium]